MRQLLWKCVIFLIATLVFDLSAADCSGGADKLVTTYFESTRSGKATFYDYTGSGGHCSLDPAPYIATSSSIFTTVAISSSTYGSSAVCGMCLNVTATGVGSGTTPLKGNYLVFVNNECPTCEGPSSLDFGKSGDGIWDVSWFAVPCPVGNTTYIFQGSHQYYIKLQARNTRYPVQAISVKVGGQYRALARTKDNFFELSATFTFPLEVQITSSTGDVVTDSIASISSSPISGKVQFPNCGTPDSDPPADIIDDSLASSLSPSLFFFSFVFVAALALF